MDYPRNDAQQQQRNSNYDYQPKYAGDMNPNSFVSEFSNQQSASRNNGRGMDPNYDQFRQMVNIQQFQNRKAVGSGRERMKNHLANSFSRNEEISIIPGFKRSIDSLPRSSVKLKSTMLREVAPTQNPRHYSSPGGLNSESQNSGYLDKSLAQIEDKERENKITRAIAQNVYKEELDRQIQQRDNIRKQESGTNNSKLHVKPAMGPSGDGGQCGSNPGNGVNTGYLPEWFPLNKPKQDPRQYEGQPPLQQQQQSNYTQQDEMNRNFQQQISGHQYQETNNSKVSPNISQNEMMYFQQQEMAYLQKQNEESYLQRQMQLLSASQSQCNSSFNLDAMRDANNSAQFRPPVMSPNSPVQQYCSPSQSHMSLQSQSFTPQGPEKCSSNTNFQYGSASPQGHSEQYNQSFQPEHPNQNLQNNGGDPMKSLLKSHVSQTADMRPSETILKKEYKTQLEIQMNERKRIEDERQATEKDEEERLQRRIQEDHLKMKLEYEEEQLRQKRKEEEFNQRQEIIFKKNAELKKKAEDDRERERQKRRSRNPLPETLEPEGAADLKLINLVNCEPEPVKPVSPREQSINSPGDSIFATPNLEAQQEIIPPVPLKLKLTPEKDPSASKKSIKPSASRVQPLTLLSDFKRILLEEADRMKEIIESRS